MGGAADDASMNPSDPLLSGTAATIACPHCGHAFDAISCRFIAESDESGLDPLAGVSLPAAATLRFLPSRFGREGFPIDPGGAACRRPACPRCREEIPFEALAAAIAASRRSTPPGEADPIGDSGGERFEGLA